MSDLEIVYHPHPALRWKSQDVVRVDATLKNMVAQMFDLMYAANGIGLAANQVALPYRLFVINPTGDRAESGEERVLLNPEITHRHGSSQADEGCLSLPEVYGPVVRPERITVEAFDLSGNPFTLELDDLPSRVVQHESDHLDGVLFTDKVAPETLADVQPLLDDLERQFRHAQEQGDMAGDDELRAELKRLQSERC